MNDKPREGDLFVPAFGREVLGGNVDFNPNGQHHSIFGEGRRFSYDVDRRGNYVPGSLHGIDPGVPKNEPGRKW